MIVKIRHAKRLFLVLFSALALLSAGTAQAADMLIGSCIRIKYSVEAIRNSGLGVQELGADNANGDKVLATDKMKGFIASVGLDKIEAVLANNDDMALGAIEALKAEGYNVGDPPKYIPVVGVDATAPALEAMNKGHLLGVCRIGSTSFCNMLK